MSAEPGPKGMKVVIIGASFVGLTCAKNLVEQDAGHDVFIVDSKDFVDLNFMTPRMLQHPERVVDTVYPFSALSWVSKATFVKASVKTMTKGSVELDNGDFLVFDFCAICTGSRYSDKYCKDSDTVDMASRVENIRAMSSRVKAAKSVLVIGGGITGMEMAAEAAECIGAGGSVTLVHAGAQLGASAAQHKLLSARVQRPGVSLVLGKHAAAADDSGKRFAWEGAEARTFDEVFWCTGREPMTAVAAGLGDVLEADGHIKVNACLQVEGYDNIFAAGDCIHVDSTQVAYLGMKHAELVASNIGKVVAQKGALAEWKRDDGFKVNIVGLGLRNVVLLFEKGCFSWVPAWLVWFKVKSSKSSIGL